MPEGDVLRRTAAGLDDALAGQVLTRAELRWPTLAGQDLTGRVVLGTRAYGKHLFTRLDDGRTLHTHLRMDGSWRIAATGSREAGARSPDVRALLGGTRWTAVGLRLGMMDLVPTREEHLLVAHLGPDLLAEDFPTAGLPEALRRWAARGATPVCEVLLDQTVVAGIGTIFMAETLHRRRTWPWTPADEVDAGALLDTARVLMQRSVTSGIPEVAVHGRLGRRCRWCGTTVTVGEAREAPMQRPVFWCPSCQPAPAPA